MMNDLTPHGGGDLTLPSNKQPINRVREESFRTITVPPWNFGMQRQGTMYISLISGRVIRASLTERPIALPPETVLERNHANPTISRGPSL